MPIFPAFPSSTMTNRLRPEGGRSAEEICHGDHAADAKGDRRLARREHRFVVRPDCGFLQAAPARSEGDRRRRCGAGYQRTRPGADRPADPRRNPEGRERSRSAPAHFGPEGAAARAEEKETTALYARLPPA